MLLRVQTATWTTALPRVPPAPFHSLQCGCWNAASTLRRSEHGHCFCEPTASPGQAQLQRQVSPGPAADRGWPPGSRLRDSLASLDANALGAFLLGAHSQNVSPAALAMRSGDRRWGLGCGTSAFLQDQSKASHPHLSLRTPPPGPVLGTMLGGGPAVDAVTRPVPKASRPRHPPTEQPSWGPTAAALRHPICTGA